MQGDIAMIRAAVKFGIASLFLHVAWHVGPVYVVHRQLQTDVVQATLGRGSDEEPLTAVLAVANRVGAQIDSDDIQVHKDDTYTYLRLTYTEPLQLLPSVTDPWTFTINAQGLAITPQLGNGLSL